MLDITGTHLRTKKCRRTYETLQKASHKNKFNNKRQRLNGKTQAKTTSVKQKTHNLRQLIQTAVNSSRLSFQKTTFYNGECHCSRQQPK